MTIVPLAHDSVISRENALEPCTVPGETQNASRVGDFLNYRNPGAYVFRYLFVILVFSLAVADL